MSDMVALLTSDHAETVQEQIEQFFNGTKKFYFKDYEYVVTFLLLKSKRYKVLLEEAYTFVPANSRLKDMIKRECRIKGKK